MRCRGGHSGYVGNVHAQAVSRLGFADVNGVIQITGIFAVDGDNVQVAKVGAPGHFLRGNELGHRSASRAPLGKFQGQLMLVYYGQDICARASL